MKTDRPLGVAGKFAGVWIGSKLTPLVIAGSLLLGAFAVWKLVEIKTRRVEMNRQGIA